MAKDKDKDKTDTAGKPKDPFRKLRKMIRNSRVAMLTTVAADGTLRSRPMATPGEGRNGELWFVTRSHSGKTGDIREDERVNVSFASPKSGRYVSVSGKASLVMDPERVQTLWRGKYKSWFPEGKRDPELALLKVTVDKAEYWDAAENRMVDLPPQPAAPPPEAVPEPPSRASSEGPGPIPGGAQG
jgi:general stress protein 26